MYELPDELRDELKQPFGTLITEDALDDTVRQLKPVHIVTVGDIVTLTFYKHNICPTIAIIDFKTKRNFIEGLRAELEKHAGDCSETLKVANPPAQITAALWSAVSTAFDRALRNEQTKIEVDGEEDLATLPAMLLAPEQTLVAYGMPDQGIVIMAISDAERSKAQSILSRMVK